MRNYITSFDPRKARPSRVGLFYECTICGDVIPSKPSDSLGCKCGNIFIDIDAGRLAIKDQDAVRLFEEDGA